ncbi:hypothetical protein NIES2104_13600 [Leptolyngbya sp. NIES-2104]|nr:hypothetical protein NIES2104_13600 [Leptolyngbya sp. NIES-2104]
MFRHKTSGVEWIMACAIANLSEMSVLVQINQDGCSTLP